MNELSIKITKASPLSKWVDLGRPNNQHLGIPHGGPLDKRAFEYGHTLLGLSTNEPSIEIYGGEMEVYFTSDLAIAISGFGFKAFVQSIETPTNCLLNIKAGATLKLKPIGEIGRTSYLTFKASIDYQGSKIQPFKNSIIPIIGSDFGTAIHRDKEYFFNKLDSELTTLKGTSLLDSSYVLKKYLRIYEGPEFETFSHQQIAHFFGSPFTLTQESNSIAFKLKETLMNYNNPIEITSSGVLPGTIQINHSGQPMLLHRNCQTTGGYPRLGIIHPDDLDTLAQKKAGDRIFFRLQSE